MEKWVRKLLVLLVILYAKVHYSDGLPDGSSSIVYERLIIDCGEDSSLFIDSTRRPDKEFIKTGENMIVHFMSDSIDEMNTLRIFPDGYTNCYDLPLQIQKKYIIRAGFYYGNYDGLLLPPTFNLQIDGKLWTTASASLSGEPIFYETIYTTKRETVSVCLVRTRTKEVPFISSLEAIKLPDDFYRLMDNNTAFNLQNRTNFGGDQLGEPLSEADDEEEAYSRIWSSGVMPNYLQNPSHTNNKQPLTAQNQPPTVVMEDAIEPQNPSDSISLLIDFPVKSHLSAYFVFYFMEIHDPNKGNRKMQIYIDGHEKGITEVPQDKTCLVVSLFPVTVAGQANVTISPVDNSTLPPILNAMEVFTATTFVSKVERSHYYSSLLLISLHILGVVLAF